MDIGVISKGKYKGKGKGKNKGKKGKKGNQGKVYGSYAQHQQKNYNNQGKGKGKEVGQGMHFQRTASVQRKKNHDKEKEQPYATSVVNKDTQ